MTTVQYQISVIVPSIRAELPEALGRALMNQSLPPHEVIHIHDEQRLGAGWARNRGIELASGQIIACIDDDCVPPAHWLESIRDAFARYDADVVGGTYEECDPFLRARRMRQQFPGVTGPDTYGHVGAGGNIAFKVEALMRARSRDGYVFNESFRMSQDWELVWRLRDLGARFVFLAVPVRHEKSLGALDYLSQQFSRGIGIAKLAQARKKLGSAVQTHRSLLWSYPGRSLWKTIAKAAWHKGIGPFDLQNFHSMRQFMLFWLGEKSQGVGYLWAQLTGDSAYKNERMGAV